MTDILKEYSVYFAIAAALFALITAIINSINFINERKRPCKIKFLPVKAFNIYKNLTGDFKKIDIKYDNQAISRNIVYLSGVLKSTRKDINTTDNKIIISAPDNCKWIDFSNSNNAELQVVFTIDTSNNNKAVLSFGKFRRNQIIRINALLETSKEESRSADSIHNNISFSHNIDNTDDVETVYSQPLPKLNKIQLLIVYTLMLIIFMVAACGYYLFDNLGTNGFLMASLICIGVLYCGYLIFISYISSIFRGFRNKKYYEL